MDDYDPAYVAPDREHAWRSDICWPPLRLFVRTLFCGGLMLKQLMLKNLKNLWRAKEGLAAVEFALHGADTGSFCLWERSNSAMP